MPRPNLNLEHKSNKCSKWDLKTIGEIPDPLTPIQYWEELKKNILDDLSPEQTLYMYLLEDALRCLNGSPEITISGNNPLNKKRHIKLSQIEARKWISGNGGHVSFEMVCDFLKIEYSPFREHLLKLAR
jgi:hypothetical protein